MRNPQITTPEDTLHADYIASLKRERDTADKARVKVIDAELEACGVRNDVDED